MACGRFRPDTPWPGEAVVVVVYRATSDRVSDTVQALGPGPWAHGVLLGQGWSSRQLESAVRGRALVRVRRGVYAPAAAGPTPSALAGSLPAAQIHATLAGVSMLAAASHESAGLLNEQWIPGPLSAVVHVTISGQAERWSAGLRVHSSRLPEEFVTIVGGSRTTTIARTGIDLARGRSLPHALVAIDGAYRRLVEAHRPRAGRELRERTVPPEVHAAIREELESAFAVTWSWPGTRSVRAALDLVEPASESAFESWSRGWILAVGLPVPVVNAEVVGHSGTSYFGDFVWRSRRLIGEADGVGKYGTNPAEVRAALKAERARQADLEAAGWRFVRWTSGEGGAHVVARIARALHFPRVTPRNDLLEA